MGKPMQVCAVCGEGNALLDVMGTPVCRACEKTLRAAVAETLDDGNGPSENQVARTARRLYREHHAGPDYLLREIPGPLWQRAKHRALDDGDTLRTLLLKALHRYLDPPAGQS